MFLLLAREEGRPRVEYRDIGSLQEAMPIARLMIEDRPNARIAIVDQECREKSPPKWRKEAIAWRFDALLGHFIAYRLASRKSESAPPYLIAVALTQAGSIDPAAHQLEAIGHPHDLDSARMGLAVAS